MLPSQPQVPEIGSKFQTIESFKKTAQQVAKAAGLCHHQKCHMMKKRQGCPVALYAVLNEKAGVWIVRSYKNQHSHELFLLSQSVADVVQWKHDTMYMKDIVNEHDRIRNALNEGSNNDTTMWLLQMLEECQYIVHHLLSKDAACHAAICLKVLIVDATYKTNLYKLPLINSVGVNNIGKAKSLNTYQIAMA
ncbi:4844_t:CDS:2 [Cetraspora pellucida]|uniref:4844_t:CDS:1 n=1 Tax=Cetraspora pellucida TaxID=1433469 RepID=A0A9N9NQZ3_9GLOM|nr:4844_t:CDS:2 [Cetraspora pellucida]